MRKVLKWAGIVLGVLLIAGFIAALAVHQPLPQGQAGPEADRLARQMLAATHKEAWDSTHYVRWTFPGGHRQNNLRACGELRAHGKSGLVHDVRLLVARFGRRCDRVGIGPERSSV